MPVTITGVAPKTATILIQKDMENLILRHNEAIDEKLNPVVRSALLHAKFVKMHPFIDGTGITARILLNTELLKASYPMAIIKKRIEPNIMIL
ncbi:MAG: Fic family protein [Wolinella sp.]